MIPIESLLYKIDQGMNKLSTNEHQQIPLEDKILHLNTAQNQVLLQALEPNPQGLGLDSFLKRYHDLEVLVQPWTELQLQDNQDPLHSFSANLSELDPPFLYFIDAFVLADKGECRARPLATELKAHATVQLLLRHAHHRPSFEYESTLIALASHQLQVYSDGSFTPTAAHLTYVRYPQAVDYEGYTHLDGSDSQTVHSELPLYLEEELVQLAIRSLTAPLIPQNTQP
jgi:hypothetical protein